MALTWPMLPDSLIALRMSLAEQLAALRGVEPADLPPALLDISVRRVGDAYYVCPADWEQLRHEEGAAGRPIPFWARPWPSAFGMATRLDEDPPAPGMRVLELGCGLGLPSIVAARAGAEVLATDGSTDAIAYTAHSLVFNGVEADVAAADWATDGDALAARGPFDLVLGADVLYTKANAETAMRLLPRLVAPGGTAWFADPGRSNSADFLAAIRATFHLQSHRDGELSMHVLRPR